MSSSVAASPGSAEVDPLTFSDPWLNAKPTANRNSTSASIDGASLWSAWGKKLSGDVPPHSAVEEEFVENVRGVSVPQIQPVEKNGRSTPNAIFGDGCACYRGAYCLAFRSQTRLVSLAAFSAKRAERAHEGGLEIDSQFHLAVASFKVLLSERPA